MYLRKSFRQLQQTLDPETILFLGDLFDGGREWSTPPGEKDRFSSDRQWRKYGEDFWLREYYRFSRIFFEPWFDSTSNHRLRKIVAGLPGNHDLGLGMGIRMPVRRRFQAYFGSGNRIDLIGNHSFVSVDTVSLSAKGQPNHDAVDSGTRKPEDIWGPTEDFLSDVKDEKDRMIYRQLRVFQGKPENEPLDRRIFDLEADILHLPKGRSHEPIDTDIPSILLTHVPLYRASGTPCGPLRERYPQAKNEAGELLESDDRNAIRVEAGVQYQNVLTPEITKELVEKIGDLEHAFSGDDHDYCEVVHRGYTSKNGGIREITVKSMSWAMGVRKPGFLMLSLWNPLDKNGKSVSTPSTKPPGHSTTLQSHLCLLPDQLSILTRYTYLLAFTVLVITINSFLTVYRNPTSSSSDTLSHPLLPLSKPPSTTNGARPKAVSALSTHPSQTGLAARSNASRARSASPFKGYALPARDSDHDVHDQGTHRYGYSADSGWDGGTNGHHNPGKENKKESERGWDEVDLYNDRPGRKGMYTRGRRREGIWAVGELVWKALSKVAIAGLGWYFWLLWTS
ncbi:MAG: hypothetical protein HETSPECPRED_000575 [Heterodermia speciosa]|uniref:Calcineurin-like phosphoesterase domain-containing protein n=1 Tax=Heterodermia speciosa TaxID=116794 RepID=A0A8H3G692_9LECA|nr:MAG: hypothetical protein HETSPECPRED_000575 [Heterodermia speciosa]